MQQEYDFFIKYIDLQRSALIIVIPLPMAGSLSGNFY